MTTTDTKPIEATGAEANDTDPDTAVEQFAERIFLATLGAQEIQAVYLGARLGYYTELADGEWLTSHELAARTSTSERYAREWLEHQAVAHYLDVDDPAASALDRRYHLPASRAEVLTDELSPAYVAPLAHITVTLGRSIDALVEAYRTGGGVSWESHGDGARHAQAAANRPMFLGELGSELLPAIPELHAALSAGARVADIGCGAGWSSIGIALAYPDVVVDGYDLDAPSIEMARRNAVDAGVADRVRFHIADVAALDLDGVFGAVVAFECIHDMSNPVEVLAAARRIAAPGAPVVVMDENVGDTFSPDAGAFEQLLYGYSLTCCLPDGMSRSPSAATGTVIRPATLDAYARDAGFAGANALPVANEGFRFYLLHD
jgi:SAM-dependent methyltransferase